jgi:aminopeptidase N
MRTLISIFLFFSLTATAQTKLLEGKNSFTRADTLRGMLTPLRTCYDVNFYHLSVSINIPEKSISGSNLFRFTATQNFRKLQFDLFENLKIDRVVYNGQPLTYTREFNAVFINFPDEIKKGKKAEFTVYYHGQPLIAKNAPWDGGFVFSQDAEGKPWVAVACQGIGASAWWPNKDHQSDEPDSALISVTVPDGLMNVSNGILRSINKEANGDNTYNWFVSYPINNYGITVNIGDYAHFQDTYAGKQGKLALDFYVLKNNLAKAKTNFEAEVKPMLASFEHWFGPYPFYRDGYKLVETPYLGLENQTAIAYGNQFKKGYSGRDLSGTGLGLTWDFIIVHESGHEWFGNNITSEDLADMWIHESFTCYSEALFVESKYGKTAGLKYLKGIRKNINNDGPLIGPYHVNKEGSADMYFKGANMLHTIRTIINNDQTWLAILRGLNEAFGLKTTNTAEIVSYISKKAGKDLSKIFDQYLRYPNPPTLEIDRRPNNLVRYRWISDVTGFQMPLKVMINRQLKTLSVTSSWQTINAASFVPDTENFYIQTKFPDQTATK